MKSIAFIAALGMMVSCDSTESKVKIRDAAIQETAENMGRAEKERFWEESRKIQERHVESCREAVARATTPAQLTLAQNDLNEAKRELHKIEKELETCR